MQVLMNSIPSIWLLINVSSIPVYIRNNKSYIIDIVSVYGPKQLIR